MPLTVKTVLVGTTLSMTALESKSATRAAEVGAFVTTPAG